MKCLHKVNREKTKLKIPAGYRINTLKKLFVEEQEKKK